MSLSNKIEISKNFRNEAKKITLDMVMILKRGVLFAFNEIKKEMFFANVLHHT